MLVYTNNCKFDCEKYARIRSWNKPVLTNEGYVFYLRNNGIVDRTRTHVKHVPADNESETPKGYIKISTGSHEHFVKIINFELILKITQLYQFYVHEIH